MFSNLRQSGAPTCSPDERIYAIGDVHGCYDLLRALIGRIDSHVALTGAGGKKIWLVLLGDLIDRGPDSARVLQYVYGMSKVSPRLIVLAGNHEEIMLRALSGEPGCLQAWLRMGGTATLASMGIPEPASDAYPEEVRDQVIAAMPEGMLEWLAGLPLTAESGDYFFCHAGVRPNRALAKQERTDLLWIRREFLDAEGAFGKVVVHGHSVSDKAEIHQNRIGIDTGAYRTGTLSALALDGQSQELICVHGEVPVPPRVAA